MQYALLSGCLTLIPVVILYRAVAGPEPLPRTEFILKYVITPSHREQELTILEAVKTS